MTDQRKAHPIRDLLGFFDQEYQRVVGSRYPVNGGKDSKLIQGLREMYTDDEIKAFMVGFFEIEDDFIQNSGYALGVFRGCLPKVIQFVKRGQQQPKKVPTNLQGIQTWMSKRAAGE